MQVSDLLSIEDCDTEQTVLETVLRNSVILMNKQSLAEICYGDDHEGCTACDSGVLCRPVMDRQLEAYLGSSPEQRGTECWQWPKR